MSLGFGTGKNDFHDPSAFFRGNLLSDDTSIGHDKHQEQNRRHHGHHALDIAVIILVFHLALCIEADLLGGKASWLI